MGKNKKQQNPPLFAPFFPHHSESEFTTILSHANLQRITLILTNLISKITKSTVQFLIRVSQNGVVPSRFDRLINALLILTDFLLIMPQLHRLAATVDQRPQPSPANPPPLDPRRRRRVGDPRDLVVCRGESAEIAERSLKVEARGYGANVYLSALTAFDGDGNDLIDRIGRRR